VNWASILTAGLSSILGSTLTILVTPSLQHYFRKHQQRAALKLKTIEAVNALSAQFIQQQWIDANGRKERYAPPLQWYEDFSATDAAVKGPFQRTTPTGRLKTWRSELTLISAPKSQIPFSMWMHL